MLYQGKTTHMLKFVFSKGCRITFSPCPNRECGCAEGERPKPGTDVLNVVGVFDDCLAESIKVRHVLLARWPLIPQLAQHRCERRANALQVAKLLCSSNSSFHPSHETLSHGSEAPILILVH